MHEKLQKVQDNLEILQSARFGSVEAVDEVIDEALEELKEFREGYYILPKETMSEPAIKSFEEFLALTKHGAKFIDIKVRKDAKEYEFQADFLKYIKPKQQST